MSITADMVLELHRATGADGFDCKEALTRNDGDLSAAADWLREQGFAVRKVPCARCGALVLPQTADAHQGLCRPCKLWELREAKIDGSRHGRWFVFLSRRCRARSPS